MIDADALGHALMEGNKRVREMIRREFGPGVFSPSGCVQREKLGELVFSDRDALRRLNAIMHPAIIEECKYLLEAFRSQGVRLAVIDAALLLVPSLPFPLDFTLALVCDREQQMARLAAKGLSREEIERRLAGQEGLEKSLRKADWVIDTSDMSIQELFREVDARLARMGMDP